MRTLLTRVVPLCLTIGALAIGNGPSAAQLCQSVVEATGNQSAGAQVALLLNSGDTAGALAYAYALLLTYQSSLTRERFAQLVSDMQHVAHGESEAAAASRSMRLITPTTIVSPGSVKPEVGNLAKLSFVQADDVVKGVIKTDDVAGSRGLFITADETGAPGIELKADGSVVLSNASRANADFDVAGALAVDKRVSVRGVPSAVYAKPLSSFGSGTFSAAVALTVVDNYLYVADYSASTVRVFDVKNGYAPVSGASVSISYPADFARSGSYLYVPSKNGGAGTINVLDVKNPAAPVLVDSVPGFNNPEALAVYGSNLYMIDSSYNTLFVFDISDPAHPVLRGEGEGTGLSSPSSLALDYPYVFVASPFNHRLQIFDVSNPIQVASVGGTHDGLSYPISVALYNGYAYVGCFGNGSIVIFDVHNPASPVHVGSITGNILYPHHVSVVGNRLFVADSSASRLHVYNLKNSETAPSLAISVPLSSAYYVAPKGNRLYVSTLLNSQVHVYDLDADALNVVGNVTVGGDFAAGRVNALAVDSLTDCVGIGTTRPTAKLDVRGPVYVDGSVTMRSVPEHPEVLLNAVGTLQTGARLLVGRINADGSVASGSGFTIEHPETGVYDIIFTTPWQYEESYSTIVTPRVVVGDSAIVALVAGSFSNSLRVRIALVRSITSEAIDGAFSFFIMGA